jgi:hypothetical protein
LGALTISPETSERREIAAAFKVLGFFISSRWLGKSKSANFAAFGCKIVGGGGGN